MTFVLTPLFHYNYITEPRARFFLSLLKDLSIDFPSHFIISIIDVYRDTTTRDKLNFPSAIMRILRSFFVPIPDSPYFTVMGAISATSVRRSKAQLQLKRPRTELTDPSASTIPSTSAPSSLGGGVTLEVIMAQLQRMNACLNTLSDKFCQVNPMLVDTRLASVVSSLLPLLLQMLWQMRTVIIVLIMMMRMRIRMLALPVMRR